MSALATVTSDTFKSEVLESPELVLVDFWAPWCGPCLKLGPILEKLAQQYTGSVRFVKLNTEESPEIAGRYGITSIPCLILFRAGKELDRCIGFDTGPRITAMITPYHAA